jgi:chromosome segregation ATPase
MDRADRTWMQRKIDVLQGEVWSMNRQNRELNKRITIKDAEIASRDDTINEILEDERQWRRKANCQKREIGKLQLELTEKWSIISRQDGELHALKGRVCDLKNGWLEETRELMQEIACARDAIDSRDGEIEKLKARIECNLNEAANERRELQRQLDFKDKQLVILNAEMMTMEEEAVTKGRQLEETVA